MESIGNPGLWLAFGAIVLFMLAIDLFVVGGGRQHRVSFREAATWSVVWVTVSFLFAAGLWWYLDGSVGREVANEKSLEFITGYLIEKSLAVDNVFVWLMLFSFFGIPLELQKRVLVLGVLGAFFGIVVGCLAAMVIYAIGIPMPPPPNANIGYTAYIRLVPLDVVTAGGIGFAATWLAAVLPARRASRMPVVEALRQGV